jgi:hypothetical protein
VKLTNNRLVFAKAGASSQQSRQPNSPNFPVPMAPVWPRTMDIHLQNTIAFPPDLMSLPATAQK